MRLSLAAYLEACGKAYLVRVGTWIDRWFISGIGGAVSESTVPGAAEVVDLALPRNGI